MSLIYYIRGVSEYLTSQSYFSGFAEDKQLTKFKSVFPSVSTFRDQFISFVQEIGA